MRYHIQWSRQVPKTAMLSIIEFSNYIKVIAMPQRGNAQANKRRKPYKLIFTLHLIEQAIHQYLLLLLEHQFYQTEVCDAIPLQTESLQNRFRSAPKIRIASLDTPVDNLLILYHLIAIFELESVLGFILITKDLFQQKILPDKKMLFTTGLSPASKLNSIFIQKFVCLNITSVIFQLSSLHHLNSESIHRTCFFKLITNNLKVASLQGALWLSSHTATSNQEMPDYAQL